MMDSLERFKLDAMQHGIRSNVRDYRTPYWRKAVKKITVEGSGVFPFDMLRYDACWPATESDSHKLGIVYVGETASVTLKTRNDYGATVGRWKSQGWRVVEVSI